jgi:ABC-2 type transport system ATP-binding protein
MIRIERLVKKYKNVQVLHEVELHVKGGELFAYLGPNGAGKTTTIKILTGQTRPDSGSAYLNGFSIQKQSLSAKQQFGLVPQSINLDRELSVCENLLLHGLLYDMSRASINQRAEELLEYIGLSDRSDSLVKELSGGLQRRLMIARAMLHHPMILFMDEPTVGLDAKIRRKIWSLIKSIQQNGTTVFLTTHYIEEAEFLADRVAFLDNGRVIVVDTPENLITRQGKWAIDHFTENNMETIYFNSRETADQYNRDHHDQYTLRRVNLEDAFLTLTGKRVK